MRTRTFRALLPAVFFAAIPLTALAALGGGQDESPAPRALTEVAAAQQPDGQTKRERAEEWKQRLSDPDLDRRLDAFDELVDEARGRREVREMLRGWADDADAGELAWTARLALREARRSRAFGPFDDPFERDFDGRPWGWFVPRGRWFGPRQDLPDLGGLQQRLDELERELDEWMRGGIPTPPQPGAAHESGRSTSVEIGPHGVKVRVTEREDGRETTRTFEADSLEALLREHPELEEELGGLRAGGGVFRFDLRPRPGGPRSLAPIAPEPGRRMLGIRCRPLPDERAEELGVERGVGLEIVEVLPGTIAAQMDLEPGDVLIELGGREVRGVEDVRAVLEAAEEDAPLEARYLDAMGQEHHTTWRPGRGRLPRGHDV